MPFTVPGDLVRVDEEGRLLDVVEPASHRVLPVCRHFGTCGGCQLQHLDDEAYRAFKRDLAIRALAQRGIEDVCVEEPVVVAPGTRRRASLKAVKSKGETRLGFNARQSHRIVDLHECHVVTPELFVLAGKLRPLMHALLKEGEEAGLHLTEADNGYDLSLDMDRAVTPAIVAEIARHMPHLGLVRVTLGGELLTELEPPRLRFGQATVRLPPHAFLQATRQSEQFLQSYVLENVGKAKIIADLFCGIGTFTLPLAAQAKVHAFDSDAAMMTALDVAVRCATGLKPVTAERRDLFRRPLMAAELNAFDAVVLDPPRAGAAAQAVQIAKSKLGRVIYISCSPPNFARDARTLIDGGFRLVSVTPVDQFLWSAQLELAARFER